MNTNIPPVASALSVEGAPVIDLDPGASSLAELAALSEQLDGEKQKLKRELKRVAYGCLDAKRQAFKDAVKSLFGLGPEHDAVVNAVLKGIPEFFSDVAAEVIHQQQAEGVADGPGGSVGLADVIWLKLVLFHGVGSPESKVALMKKYFSKRDGSVGVSS